MARGWESKSVEEQMAERTQSSPPERSAGNAAGERQRQELELQRERILAERTSSPHRRTALAAALNEIEARLRALGSA
jgi:hypothetical protein